MFKHHEYKEYSPIFLSVGARKEIKHVFLVRRNPLEHLRRTVENMSAFVCVWVCVCVGEGGGGARHMSGTMGQHPQRLF